jgi:hypothetical protein
MEDSKCRAKRPDENKLNSAALNVRRSQRFPMKKRKSCFGSYKSAFGLRCLQMAVSLRWESPIVRPFDPMFLAGHAQLVVKVESGTRMGVMAVADVPFSHTADEG